MQKRIVLVSLLTFTAMFGCNRRIFNSPTIRQLPKEEYLAKLAETDNVYIIDVRTRMEYDKGHLEGAESISIIDSFKKRAAVLDTNRTVFVYCETAHRSPFATIKLKKLGFKRIYDLEGGYSVLRKKK